MIEKAFHLTDLTSSRFVPRQAINLWPRGRFGVRNTVLAAETDVSGTYTSVVIEDYADIVDRVIDGSSVGRG